MRRVVVLVAFVAVQWVALGCSFQFDPVALPKYYRAEGWQLPGIADYNLKAPPDFFGDLSATRISGLAGLKARLLPHAQGYIVDLPPQVFTLNGKALRLRRTLALASVVRWELNGKRFAYGYGLIPIDAHRVRGEWEIDSEAGCIFDATFIDEKGDGVFRTLVPGPLDATMIPEWVKRPEMD